MLEVALARARAGDGSLVLVSGDAGTGKSRLIAEAGLRARAAGAVVITGECPDLGEGELPYAPIAGALRSLVRERGAEETASLFDPGGEVLGLLVPDAAPERRPAGGFAEREGAQGRLFARLLAGLSAASRESPLVLVVEDLHGRIGRRGISSCSWRVTCGASG